jgi:presenilin-like A22 family membrane protease
MRNPAQYLVMFAIFIFVPVAAIYLLPLLLSTGDYQAFQDPQSPVNPLLYFALILGMTVLMLVLIKFAQEKIMKAIFYTAMTISIFSITLPIFFYLIGDVNISLILSVVSAVGLMAWLALRPEWYIIDSVAVLIGVGATAILGISLGILPALILLSILAVYDAISVYKTKHMLSLAEGVTKMRLPVLFYVPKKLDFKVEQMDNMDLKDRDKDQERETMIMGVGDAVIPGILIVSVMAYLPYMAPVTQIAHADVFVTAGTLIGACIGFGVLMRYVATGRPQAGLPLLNGGAILGFLISYLLVFQDLNFGFL